MNKEDFKKYLNTKFNEIVDLFQQFNQSSEENKIELHTNILIKLSCFGHFLIEHYSYLKNLPKSYLSLVYTLLSIAKAENLSSAVELNGILEAQGIRR